jgi:hypothetical protein
MGLLGLVTNLCRDDNIEKVVKHSTLLEWKEKWMDAGANRLMDKEQAETHFNGLEILENALRITKPDKTQQ